MAATGKSPSYEGFPYRNAPRATPDELLHFRDGVLAYSEKYKSMVRLPPGFLGGGSIEQVATDDDNILIEELNGVVTLRLADVLRIQDLVFEGSGPVTLASASDIILEPGEGGVVQVRGAAIEDVGTPTNPTDATTKAYVDTAISALQAYLEGLIDALPAVPAPPPAEPESPPGSATYNPAAGQWGTYEPFSGGTWTSPGTSFNATSVLAGSNGWTSDENIAAISFASIDIPADHIVEEALLFVQITSAGSSPILSVRAERSASSQAPSNGNLPVSWVTTTAAVVVNPPLPGVIGINVKPLVDEVRSGTAWATGGRFNFQLRVSNLVSTQYVLFTASLNAASLYISHAPAA
jgi:hypothetical protein